MNTLNKKNPHGNAMVEYVLITAMVALAAVAIFRAFRSDVSQAYKQAGQALVEGVNERLVSEADGRE